MADVVASLLDGLLTFCQGRAAELAGSTLKEAATLAGALRTGARSDDIKAILGQFHDDVVAAHPLVQPTVAAIQPHLTAFAAAVAQMSAELAAAPFTLAAAGRAATQLATAAGELDAAIAIIAHALGSMDDPVAANRRPLVETAINAIDEPWVAALRALGGAGADFRRGRVTASRISRCFETAAGPFRARPAQARALVHLRQPAASGRWPRRSRVYRSTRHRSPRSSTTRPSQRSAIRTRPPFAPDFESTRFSSRSSPPQRRRPARSARRSNSTAYAACRSAPGSVRGSCSRSISRSRAFRCATWRLRSARPKPAARSSS